MRQLPKLLLAAAVLLIAAAATAYWLTPFPEALRQAPAPSLEFVDREGRTLRTLLVEDSRYQGLTTLSEISPHLVAATLAAEDKRFYRHGGVDAWALLRASTEAVRGRAVKSGASTITQQLIKITHPGPRTWSRKLTEMWLALRVERSWSKERILEEYFNRLDYGNLQVGIGSASRFYFGKAPIDLSPAEAALLAALPNAPSRLNPHHHFASARERQRWILGRMVALGSLDQATHDRAMAEPLLLQPPGREWAAPYFVDLLLRRTGLADITSGRVTTTLDLDLTRRAEGILQDQLRELAGNHMTAGAVVILDNATGDVLALAGQGAINGAWEPRSPGSALKPFTYLLALEKGDFPGTVVADVPSEFSTPTGTYRPNNFNHRFDGPVSLRQALGNSLNVAAIQTLKRAGGPAALHYLLLKSGFTTLGNSPEYYGLGLTLGNGEVRLLELANAFAALARGGWWQPFRLLQNSAAPAITPRRICSETSAWLLADMLSDDHARAASFGLNSYLALPFAVAAKTGTSSNYRDNVIVGYTPEFTVAVWTGNPDASPMREITGVTGAAPVMHEIFLHLNERFQLSWLPRPGEIQDVVIHPLTGHRLISASGGQREKAFHLPPMESPADYDAGGRVVLGPEYREWLKGPQSSLRGLAVIAESDTSPIILSPKPGTHYYLDPDLPTGTQRIRLSTNLTREVRWASPTLDLEATAGGYRVELKEGLHTLTVEDAESGHTASTWIRVEAL